MQKTDFRLFSPVHFVILALILGVAFGLTKIVRARPDAAWLIRRLLAASLIVNEIVWYAYRYSTEGFRFPEGLPLQLCDALVWLTAAALLTQKQWVFEAAYFLGLAGAGMALITPDLWAPLLSYPSIYFFLVHGAIVWSLLFLVWARLMRPQAGCVRRVLIFVNVFAAVVGGFNAIFGTNYMYLCRKPQGASLLDWFGPWPVYLLVGEVFALLLFALLWQPWRRRAALFLILLTFSAPAADIAKWEAGADAIESGIRLERADDSPWNLAREGTTWVARLRPSTDYYSRSSYHLRIERSGRWLVLEFADRGYGLIQVSPGVGETRQWGVARVNTGKMRKAVFQYDKGVPARVRVEGLDYLRAARVTDDPPPIEQAPLVEPAVSFRLPGERISSVPGDATSADRVADALAGIRNQAPLLRALGFNGVETYVRWGYVERKQGVYDWSFYDAILIEIEKHGLQWFPMLLAGSGYALPAWLHDSKELNYGFKCLEHGIVHDTQSIFQPFQTEYASRFIAEFGKHYGARKSLLGIRLGPSGDYGEAQYPAKGPGYGFQTHHTHIGYWAADDLAQASFRARMQEKYGDIAKLNAAWETQLPSFEELKTFLPETAVARRMRVDFADWYMGAMSDWCEKWARWSRAALPNTSVHQSSGGWGPVQIGTDYSYQARSMARVQGGIRLTNEGDDFPDNFTITRMASSAARFYGAALGYEPGGFGSKRGVMARLYNAVTNGAVHLFYYLGNLTSNDQAIDAWLRNAKMLDARAKPVIDVAAFYPDTALKLDDEVLRYRWASTFFTAGRALRAEMDFDYASEQMILDGALDRYRILVFLWGAVMEKPVLERLDAWVRNGGVLVFAQRPRGNPVTVEGDGSISAKWIAGDTGKGSVVVYHGDLVPGEDYAEFLRNLAVKTPAVHPRYKAALAMEKPERVYWSVLDNGKLALLNFSGKTASVKLAGGRVVTIAPFEPVLIDEP